MRENYKGYPWFGRQKIWHQYPLTDAEKLELAAKMAEARAEMSRLEDELAGIKKSYRELIDAQSGNLGEAAMKFRAGLGEQVEVFCDVYQDLDRDELVFVTVEGCEEIVRRPMRPSERQPGLFYDSARLAGDVEKLKGGKHGGSQEENNGEC